MPHADTILADDEIVHAVHRSLAKRHPQSLRRGRPGFSAKVVLRWLILKHARNWSYQILEREVRANLGYRDFTRIGSEKVPDAKTMGRWGAYSSLLEAAGRVVGQARRFSQEIGAGVKRCTTATKQVVLEGQRQVLDKMVPLVQQVMRQTKARIFHGDSRSEGKIVSVFEPTTEVIRKGKTGKPTEFGK